MSYDVPTKKYAIAADVDALGTFLAQRQSDSGTTNGGIVASGGSPPLAQLGVDPAGISLSVFKAQADALLCAVGFQAYDEQACSGSSTVSATSFTLISTMPSYTFVAPIARTYVVRLDLAGIFQSTGTFGLTFQVLNSSTGVATASGSWQWYPPASINVRGRASFAAPVAMQAGNNVLQVRCKVLNAGDVAGFDGGVWRALMVQ